MTMTSKRSGRKDRTAKRKKASPSEKPAATVTDLFKKQLLKQVDSKKNTSDSGDEDCDDGSTAVVREEQVSLYFSPSKVRNGFQRSGSHVGGDSVKQPSESCCEEKKAAHSESKEQPAADVLRCRLSHKLSLRKANDDRKNRAQTDAAICSVSSAHSSQGNCHTVFSKQELKPVKSTVAPDVKDTETPPALDKDMTHTHDCDTATSVDRQLGSAGCEAARTSVSDGVHTVSVKGKLSLKCKRKSQDRDTGNLGLSSPKVANTVSSPKVLNTVSKPETLETQSVKKPAAHVECGSVSLATPECEKSSSFTSKHFQPSAIISPPKTQTDPDPGCVTSTATSSTGSRSVPTSTSGPEARNNEVTDMKHEAAGATLEATEDDADDAKEEDLYRMPYYLENFNTILKLVFSDDYHLPLFNETDLKHVTDFNNLSEASQKLYVRLFSRKLAWLSTSKMKYPEIAQDLTPCLEELVEAGLLCSGERLDDLSAALGAMTAPDLRTLAKSYHINLNGQQKSQIVQTLVSKSQQNTVASLFGQKTGGVKAAMLKRAKSMLGPVYRLYKESRAVFMRAMMLFSLINTNGDEESGNGGQRQLFQMLMVNIGRVVYPAFTVNRHTQIFRSREDLIRFEEALQLESELLGYTTVGNWKMAYTVFLMVRESFEQLVKDSAITEWDSHLPDFLRCYSAGSVLTRLLNQGIEILQRRKDYPAAVALIRELLDQQVYQQDHRGYWWDRLALNLDVHLKQQKQALQAIGDGLADPQVRLGHRLSLYLRAEVICTRPKSPFRNRLKDFYHDPMVELPKTYVDGRVLPHTLPGCRYQFITNTSYSEGNVEDVTLCNVEQIVLDHYALNGFPQGIHAEGSVVSTLFCLFLWDVLFMDVPDAFHSPYQTGPLDIQSDAFYRCRQTAIDDRLARIEGGDEEDLQVMVEETWDRQKGVMCAGINWDRFTSVQEVQGLVCCMGGKVLAGILRRYAKQPRHTRSGFPDLTLWNTATKQLKISEVKGPGDRLSHKQMLWLDHLLKLGVDAEVCHVRPVGVKKLKPQTKLESTDEGHNEQER